MKNFAWLASQLVVEFGELLASISSRAPQGATFLRMLSKLELQIIEELSKRHVAREVVAAAHGITAEGLRIRRARLEGQKRMESLVETVLRVIREAGGTPLDKREIAQAIYASGSRRYDQVYSVLRHLSQSGILHAKRVKNSTVYEEGPRFSSAAASELDALLICARQGPILPERLAEILQILPVECSKILEPLLKAQLIEYQDGMLVALEAEILFGEPSGLAAGIYDHVQSMCRAITKKIDGGATQALPDAMEGGATFSLKVPHDHPLRGEILGFLSEANVKLRAWRLQTKSFEPSVQTDLSYDEITIYFGQMVVQHDVRRTQTE